MRLQIASLLVALALPAYAADHRVQMLNKTPDGRMMGFDPLIVQAEPGDTVTFVATDKGHNSVSIKNGTPEGQAEWKGNISSDISVTVSAEGVYMYACVPHFGLGMIGAIVVGKPVNLDSVKALKYPGKAQVVADEIFTKIAGGGQQRSSHFTGLCA